MTTVRRLGSDSPLFAIGLFVFWAIQLVQFVGYIAANCPAWITVPALIGAVYYAIWFVTRDDA